MLSPSHPGDDGEVYEEPDEADIAVFLSLLDHYPHIDLFLAAVLGRTKQPVKLRALLVARCHPWPF